ncbi:hypothetical protein FA821_13300 [Salmonella enterica]|nr:hypothetical protein [Salmonella enterica]
MMQPRPVIRIIKLAGEYMSFNNLFTEHVVKANNLLNDQQTNDTGTINPETALAFADFIRSFQRLGSAFNAECKTTPEFISFFANWSVGACALIDLSENPNN